MDGAEKENGEETDWEEKIIAAKEAAKIKGNNEVPVDLKSY